MSWENEMLDIEISHSDDRREARNKGRMAACRVGYVLSQTRRDFKIVGLLMANYTLKERQA